MRKNEREYKLMDTKRKTKTSSAVKARYNKKTYIEIRGAVPRELGEAFKKKCEELEKPQAQIIKKAIEKFLTDHEAFLAD